MRFFGSTELILVLTPKNGKKTEIPATIAELEIVSVTPESSREALEKWIGQAPNVVNKFTPYTLKVVK
jgi:hypothetical protein